MKTVSNDSKSLTSFRKRQDTSGLDKGPTVTPSNASLPLPLRSDERLPITCRLVSTDQWLKTHVDASWTVRQVKVFLLARCEDPLAPFPLTFNPAPSPIFPDSAPPPPPPEDPTPAQPQTTSLEDDEGSASDPIGVVFARDPDKEFSSDSEDEYTAPVRRRKKPKPPKCAPSSAQAQPSLVPPPKGPIGATSEDPTLPTKPGAAAPSETELYINRRYLELSAQQYDISCFSSGLVLEEGIKLEDYRLRPHELLEIQRKTSKVHIPRTSYTDPYFDAPACVRLVKNKDKHHHTSSSSNPPYHSRQDTLHMNRDHDPPFYNSNPSIKSHLSAPFHRHQPYRSPSATFAYDPNLEHPMDMEQSESFMPKKWKGKDRDGSEYNSSDKNFLPPSLGDSVLAGASLPGIGYAARFEEEERRKAQERREKKEITKKGSKDWKMKWLVVQHRKLTLCKDRQNDPHAIEVYDLAGLFMVKEVSVPPHLMLSMPKATTSTMVSLRLVGRSQGNHKSSSHHRRTRVEINLNIRLMSQSIHDHFLRVIYRILISSQTMNSHGSHFNRSPSLVHSASFSPFTPPLPLRSMSPYSFTSSSRSPSPPPLDERKSPSPVDYGTQIHHHRHVRSLSRPQSTPSLSGSISRSSRSLSRDGKDYSRHPPQPHLPNPSPFRRQLSLTSRRGRGGYMRKGPATPTARSLHHSHSQEQPGIESQSGGEYYNDDVASSVPGSAASSPQQRKSMSSPPPISYGHPPLHRPSSVFHLKPPPLAYVTWRGEVLRQSAVAGRGEARLRRGNAYGPWQYSDDEDRLSQAPQDDDTMGTSVDDDIHLDEDEDDLPLAQLGAARLVTKSETRGRSQMKPYLDIASKGLEDDISEYEWENWRIDAGYVPTSMPNAREAYLATPSGTTPYTGESYSRRGSIPLAVMSKNFITGKTGLGVVVDSASSQRSSTATSSPFASVSSKGSFADVAMGRARSKSVITITPQPHSGNELQYQQQQSPMENQIVAHAYSTATSPFFSKTPGGQGHAGNRKGGGGGFKGKRPRSSTTSAAIHSPRPLASTQHSPLLPQVPLTRSSSNQSDISLTAALNLPPTPPLPQPKKTEPNRTKSRAKSLRLGTPNRGLGSPSSGIATPPPMSPHPVKKLMLEEQVAGGRSRSGSVGSVSYADMLKSPGLERNSSSR